MVNFTYVRTAMDEGRLDEPDNCKSLSSSSSPLVDVCGMGHMPESKDMSPPVVIASTAVSIWPSLEFNENHLKKCTDLCNVMY